MSIKLSFDECSSVMSTMFHHFRAEPSAQYHCDVWIRCAVPGHCIRAPYKSIRSRLRRVKRCASIHRLTTQHIRFDVVPCPFTRSDTQFPHKSLSLSIACNPEFYYYYYWWYIGTNRTNRSHGGKEKGNLKPWTEGSRHSSLDSH